MDAAELTTILNGPFGTDVIAELKTILARLASRIGPRRRSSARLRRRRFSSTWLSSSIGNGGVWASASSSCPADSMWLM